MVGNEPHIVDGIVPTDPVTFLTMLRQEYGLEVGFLALAG